MILNNFNSYFELFAGFSLAYSGFSYIRKELEQSIFKISEIPKELTLMLDEIKVKGDDNDAYFIKAEFIDAKFDLVNKKEKSHTSFFMENFRMIYLISFFYNITLIIVGGIQQSSLMYNINDFVQRLSILVLFFYGVLFYYTFFIDKFPNKRIISPFFTTFIYFGFIFISAFTPYSFELGAEIEIANVLFTSITSYLFLFSRVYFHRNNFNKKYNIAKDEALLIISAIRDFRNFEKRE